MRKFGFFLVLLAGLWGVAEEACAMERSLERKIDAAFADGKLSGLRGVRITAQPPLGFANGADAVLFGRGLYHMYPVIHSALPV